jgi:hypothetical protein
MGVGFDYFMSRRLPSHMPHPTNARTVIMEERVTYTEMRSWLLECYYTYCQGKFIAKKRSWSAGELEINWAYEEFYDSFELPIERLMLEVLTLILIGGRLPESFHREQIARLLAEHSLDGMLQEIPTEETDALLYDMKLLKLA